MEVGTRNGKENRVNFSHGFDLDDDQSLHQQIQSVLADATSLEHDEDFFLAFESKVAKFQFDAQCLFVNRFEETRTQMSMHLNGRTNYSLGQFMVV